MKRELGLLFGVGISIMFKRGWHGATSDLGGLHEVPDLGFVLIGKVDTDGSLVLFLVSELLRAWNRNDIVALL